MGACNLILIDTCQNSVSADQHRLTISRAQVSTHWVPVFLKLSADKLLLFKWLQAEVQFFLNVYKISRVHEQHFSKVAAFQMIAGSSSIFLKCIWNKLCSWATLVKFWFWTDLGCKNSTGFYMQGRQSLLTFLTVTRWSRFTSNICSDWSKFDRWVHAENLCSIWKLAYW